MDQYHINLGISAQEYAKRKAMEFKNMRLSVTGGFNSSSSQHQTDILKSPSTGDLSDEDLQNISAMQRSHLTTASAMGGKEIVYEFEAGGDKALTAEQQLKKNLNEMMQIQKEQNDEMIESSKGSRGSSLPDRESAQRMMLSKSTVS